MSAPGDTLPATGAIDLFVDARDQSVEGIANLVGNSSGVRGAADQVIDAMVGERRKPFVLAMDALDEAGEQAAFIARWLAELADRGRAVGIRALVGTRPGGPHRELIRELGPHVMVCDLDGPEYFEFNDLVAAVEARLIAAPGAHVAGRRADRELANKVACAVAERAQPSFLVAWAAGRGLALRSEVLSTSGVHWRRLLPADARHAMAVEFDPGRFAGPEQRKLALDLLTALAYGRGLGLPLELWPTAASAIAETARYGDDDIERLFGTTAGDLVDQVGNADGTSSYRLFHEELAGYLRAQQAEPQAAIERRITQAMLRTVPEADGARQWDRCPAYVRMHLAGHAAAAGALDGLLADAGFLLAADPGALRVALVQGALAAAPPMEGARVAIVHALARQAGSRAERAAAMCMALRRQGEPSWPHGSDAPCLPKTPANRVASAT